MRKDGAKVTKVTAQCRVCNNIVTVNNMGIELIMINDMEMKLSPGWVLVE
jgi:hypothetical protein